MNCTPVCSGDDSRADTTLLAAPALHIDTRQASEIYSEDVDAAYNSHQSHCSSVVINTPANRTLKELAIPTL